MPQLLAAQLGTAWALTTLGLHVVPQVIRPPTEYSQAPDAPSQAPYVHSKASRPQQKKTRPLTRFRRPPVSGPSASTANSVTRAAAVHLRRESLFVAIPSQDLQPRAKQVSAYDISG